MGQGRIALLRENDHHAQHREGGDRIVLVRLLNTNDLPHEILGGFYIPSNQVPPFKHGLRAERDAHVPQTSTASAR